MYKLMVMNGRLPPLSFHVNPPPPPPPPPHSSDKAVSNFWPWNFKAEFMGMVKGQGHTVSPVYNLSTYLSFHINQTNNSWNTAISKFDIEKSKVKVMGEDKGWGHIVQTVSNRCTSFSFQVNRINHSWDMANRVFDLENQSFQQNFSKI